MLLLPPTEAELTSYNKIKFAKEQIVTFFTATELLGNNVPANCDKLIFPSLDSGDIYSNKYLTVEMKNPALSTWNETDDLDDLDVNAKLIIAKSYKVKSVIKSIKKYTPRVIID